MNKTLFHRAIATVLMIALAFGQLGVSFLHNKHDAHESVVDLDHTVLVNHGEHCKICAIDLAHEILAPSLDLQLSEASSDTPVAFHLISSTSFSQLLTKDRAPPVLA